MRLEVEPDCIRVVSVTPQDRAYFQLVLNLKEEPIPVLAQGDLNGVSFGPVPSLAELTEAITNAAVIHSEFERVLKLLEALVPLERKLALIQEAIQKIVKQASPDPAAAKKLGGSE